MNSPKARHDPLFCCGDEDDAAAQSFRSVHCKNAYSSLWRSCTFISLFKPNVDCIKNLTFIRLIASGQVLQHFLKQHSLRQ